MTEHEDENIWMHPDFLLWAQQVRTGMFPKMQDSSVNLALITDAELDVKLAVEIGYGIMLDKPLIVLLTKGATISKKLALVADEVIRVDLDDEAGTQAQIMAALDRMPEQQ